jgi:hypothetical protein
MENFLSSGTVGMVAKLHTFTGLGDGQDALCSPSPSEKVITHV